MRYITGFKESIQKSDIKEAKKILDQFPGETDETKFELINELALVPDNAAWELLFYLAVEIKIFDKEIYKQIIQLIMDRAHLNFKFAIILYKTGKIKDIKGGVPLMRYILSNSTDQYIISETIETAGKEKILVLVDAIAEYIYYDNAILKEKAVKALGNIGSKEAIHRLEQASATIKSDNNILNTLKRLGSKKLPAEEKTTAAEKKQTRKIRPVQPVKSTHKTKLFKTSEVSKDNDLVSLYEQLKSKTIDTRFKALNSIAEMDEADHSSIICENLKSENHDLKINSLRFISKTISENFLPDIYALLNDGRSDPEIKFTALETLYSFPALDSAAVIIDKIEDPVMYVRIAAAAVLNKHPTNFVFAEIKDKIESGEKRGENIVHAIIDSKAENIINFLMVSDTFSYIASNYLSRTASYSCLEKYIVILKHRGLKSTAKKFENMLMEKKAEIRPYAAVISSSTVVQDVYGKLLFRKGYNHKAYKSCQDAFEAISLSKPAFVLCDLFLNKMTGIDFSREIREFYHPQDLPFIISSRQKDFTGKTLEKECRDAGVNVVMKFPAKIPEIN